MNWRSFPFVWHVKLWFTVPLCRFNLIRYGAEDLRVFSVAQDPFKKIVSKKDNFVSIDSGDWNLHLSNASYPKALDTARFQWLLEIFGIAMGEGLTIPLASTTFAFFKEIPMLSTYDIDLTIVSYDAKWIYYVAKFTSAPPANSPPGTPRILNCLALNKSCFKLGRLTIPPSRVLSYSGLGPDRSNYLRMLDLRKRGKGKAWLKYGIVKKEGNGVVVEKEEEKDWGTDGMEGYEERRIERMALVEGFRDVSHWADL